jgi:hypothetical protein
MMKPIVSATHVAVGSLALVAVFGPISAAADQPAAVDHAAVLAPFVNDDTFAVGYLNLGSLDLGDGELQGLLRSLPEQSQTVFRGVDQAVQGFQAAGVDGVYAVLSLDNVLPDHGPFVVIALGDGADARTVENTIQALAEAASASGAGQKVVVRPRGPRVLIAGSQRTVARYDSFQPGVRDDLTAPLATMTAEGAELAAVFSPGADFRRVVRELWPELPPPMTPLRGELADRWLRLEFEAKTQAASDAQAEPAARLTMQATDRESAELFVELLRALPAASGELTELGPRRQELSRVLQTIVGAVPTRVDGPRVVMTLPTDDARIAKLRGLISDAGDAAMESARRHERMQQFKQLALAMHNYADRNKHLPPAAIRDENGHPLLSWRVAILPWVEQSNLYRLFHFNEPWDSPHNRALIDKMPDVFADPSPRIRRLAGKGKTTYVVPAGAGTVFDRPEGTTFKEITDGTSKTIMLVEVPPERAVEWTKPADWQVDLEHPLQGVERTDRDYVTAAWCDGSGSVIPTDVEPDRLRAILTRAGREVVDRP